MFFDRSQQFFYPRHGMSHHATIGPGTNDRGKGKNVRLGIHFFQYPVGVFGHLPAPLRPLPPSALRVGILVEIRPLLAPSATLYCPVTMPLLNSPSYSVDPGYSLKDTAGMRWIQYRTSGMAGTVSQDVDGRVDMRPAVPIDADGTYCNRKLLVIPTCFGLKKLLYRSKIRKILTFNTSPPWTIMAIYS